MTPTSYYKWNNVYRDVHGKASIEEKPCMYI